MSLHTHRRCRNHSPSAMAVLLLYGPARSTLSSQYWRSTCLHYWRIEVWSHSMNITIMLFVVLCVCSGTGCCSPYNDIHETVNELISVFIDYVGHKHLHSLTPTQLVRAVLKGCGLNWDKPWRVSYSLKCTYSTTTSIAAVSLNPLSAILRPVDSSLTNEELRRSEQLDLKVQYSYY